MLKKIIVLNFLAFLFAVGGGMLDAQDSQLRFSATDQPNAWERIPLERPPLPLWARILVEPLPKATAALIELDNLHRAKNPVGPVLAGKLRWAVADAIGCEYGRKCAEADLRRAGVHEDELLLITGTWKTLPEADRAVVGFARQLTMAGHEVSDNQVAALISQFGTEQVVGIVHTVAFANFENRLFLALEVPLEADGALPPVELKIDPGQQAEVVVPTRRPWEESLSMATSSDGTERIDWSQQDFSALEKALNRQQNRSLRIALPAASRLDSLPPDTRERTKKIIWSNISVGYQPQLTGGWFRLMQVFRDEAMLDKVFANSVFWVVTRSNECFY
jgi:alkylhydroperoxidase family enzyme